MLRTFALISVCTHSTLNELLFCSINTPFLTSRCVYKGSHMELLELQGMQSHPFLVLLLVATKISVQIILVAVVGLPLFLQGVEARRKGPKSYCMQFGLCKLSACWWRQEQGCLGSACNVLLSHHLNTLGLATPPIIWYYFFIPSSSSSSLLLYIFWEQLLSSCWDSSVLVFRFTVAWLCIQMQTHY